MDRELIQDYLQKAQMEVAQAEALSRILSQMATKSDLVEIRGEMASLVERLEGKMSRLEERLSGQMSGLRSDVAAQMAHLESRLTWRMIAVVGFFATAATIMNAILR